MPKKPPKTIKCCRTCGLQFKAICANCQRNPKVFIRDYWIDPKLVQKLYPQQTDLFWFEFGLKATELVAVLVIKIDEKNYVVPELTRMFF